jgi:alginate O-acetyltransferase complex protein AlgI
MVANYFFGRYIEKYQSANTPRGSQHAKIIFILSLCFNLGIFILFKYINFFVNNYNDLVAGSEYTVMIRQFHLPIGISFFTFQALSYVFDVYRKDVKASTSLIDFSMYKAFFPQLIAGPIVRYRDVSHQIVERITTIKTMSAGIKRFIIGLAKKVLIANTLASFVDQVFEMPPEMLSTSVAWLGIVCYALQIYFDFSGYSDMAIGLAKMFGFDFLENFNYPYIAQSIRDFWRRWHISLSTWFRDYLYIPLGGNRGSVARVYGNLLMVFLFCGLWHGANWTFVLWGLWHGIFLVLERTKFGKVLDSTFTPARHLYTSVVILIGWVFFRAETVSYAIGYLKVMFGFSINHSFPMMLVNAKTIIALVLGLIGSTPFIGNLFNHKEQDMPGNGRSRAALNELAESMTLIFYSLFFLTCVVFLSFDTYNPFIYFRF